MKHCFLGCFVLTFLMAGIGLQALPEAPWANFGANAARTLQSPYPGPAGEMELLVKVPALDRSCGYGPPAAAAVAENGSVFTVWDKLYGYDSQGTAFLTANLGPDNGFRSGPILGGGLVCAGLVNKLYTFSASGARVGTWTVPYPDVELYFRPGVLGPGGRLILPAAGDPFSSGPCEPSEGKIFSILPDGETEWDLGVGTLLSPPAVSADGRVFFSAEDPVLAPYGKALVCLAPDGSFVWRFNRLVRAIPAVNDELGLVVVRAGSESRDDESVVALNIDTGEPIWEFSAPAPYSYPFYGADEPFWHWVKALALDAPRGITYAFWDGHNGEWQLMTAIGPAGELLWSWERKNTYECTYHITSHPILDVDGFVYLVSGFTRYTVEKDWTTVNYVEVLDHQGQTVSLYEHECVGFGPGWGASEPAIGPDQRLYLFAPDIESTSIYEPPSCLYIFGPSGAEQPERRPSILSAGYGFSRVTTEAGGVLTINAKVSHPLGASNIEAVEVRLYGVPTGLCLLPGGKSDSEYSVSIDLPAGFVPAGQFLLELVARDKEGRTSDVWPYMTVAAE